MKEQEAIERLEKDFHKEIIFLQKECIKTAVKDGRAIPDQTFMPSEYSWDNPTDIEKGTFRIGLTFMQEDGNMNEVQKEYRIKDMYKFKEIQFKKEQDGK